ncbi:MAG TPA: arginine--tRNA ligase [Sporichthyaceae bacterium]|nr:arginine--tRNA ligase [Sporichthyaceae bacterium]
MTPAELADAVQIAVYTAVQAGELDVDVPRDIHLERSRRRDHGDYASNIAMQLAKSAGMPPRELAEIVARHLRGAGGVRAVEVAGPGFLNISLDSETAGRLALTVVAAGPAYGRSETLRKQRINLEFVSANPTGPVHLGHTRWAAVGDSLRRVLEAAGADVVSEYYINDAGVQMQKFAASLYAAARGLPAPEDGYAGEYIADVTARILAAAPQLAEMDEAAALPELLERGYRMMLADIAASLERFGVHFDVWFSERALHNSGRVDEAIATLREQGHVFDLDGAVWLRTTDFGDDKDRVLVKADGEKTYFAADAAYYLDKRSRGFDTCVYLLGADHHGYINRLRALAACAGDDPDRSVQVLIGQLVKLMRGGQELKMSKRAGTVVTLDELVDLVGVDAARYSLARASTDSQLVLDVEEITRAAPENPVYYVQYVAARTASLARNARELGLNWSAPESFRPQLLVDDREALLLGALGEFPRTVATAAELREPHRIARYLEDLAGTYHRFYDGCRILPRGEEEVSDLHLARLWLNDATRTVISNGLAMLGVSAPERM